MNENQIKFRVWNSKYNKYLSKVYYLMDEDGVVVRPVTGDYMPVIESETVIELGIKCDGEKGCLFDWWYEGDLVELNDGCIYLVAFMEFKFVLRFYKDPVNKDMLADGEGRYTLGLWEEDFEMKLVGNIHEEEK